MRLRLYEIDTNYINELRQIDKRVQIYHGKHNRPYLGIVLSIDMFNYFVPLSSYKSKHDRVRESIFLVKLEKFSVLNINNMVPVPNQFVKQIDFDKIDDTRYLDLLQKEYSLCRKNSERIKKNAKRLHSIEKNMNNENQEKLKQCCSFSRLESYCKEKYFKK